MLDDTASQLVVTAAVLIWTVLLFALLVFRSEDGSAVDFEVPYPEACRDTSELKVLDAPSIQTPGSTAIQCYCPANGKFLGLVNPTTSEGINRAIAKAKKAQTEWAKTTFAQRRKLLRTLSKFILANQDDIVRIACLDSGKTRTDASFGEVLVTAEKLAWTIKHGEKALRPSQRSTNLLMVHKHNEVRYEPFGVVAALVSWNYPFHNLLNPTISALFAGNAIVLKTSEQTAFSATYFISIVRAALSACGHSPELVQSIVCWPSVAPHLTSHPEISHITFIGSRSIAHAVASSASRSLTPLLVELGGKDAAIVLDCASQSSIRTISSTLMRGVFQAAGQNCIGIERIIALPRAYDLLIAELAPRVQSLRVGSPLDDPNDVDVGACISDRGFDALEELIRDAERRGAKVLCGGTRIVCKKWPKGHYFAPTMVVGVTRDMPIAQKELFAPVLVLMRAETVEDAISIANDTEYGLGCSVFGENKRDLEKVVNGAQVGMVSVNDFASYYMCSMPFGGAKGSGYGRFGGEEGLRALCNAKSVTVDRLDWLGIQTTIPPRLDYKIRDADGRSDKVDEQKSWDFVKGVVGVGYAAGLAGKLKALTGLLKNM